MTTRTEVELAQLSAGLEDLLLLQPAPRPPRRADLFHRTKRPAPPSPLGARMGEIEDKLTKLTPLVSDARRGFMDYPCMTNKQNLRDT